MRLRWIIFWAVGVVAVAITATQFAQEFSHRRELERLIQQKEAALVEAQDKLERAREQVEFFRSDEGKAWIARDKLNMAFSGERIYKIVDD